jgi:protein-tyrosine phosphatase
MATSIQNCDVCGINWKKLKIRGIHKICSTCSNLYRCKMCKTLLYPDTRAVACDRCWDTLGISKITDDVYLSDHINAKRYDELKQLGIKQILSIGSELTPHETTEFRKVHIHISDHPEEDIKQYFQYAIDFIKQGPTLVHCYAGISRSASLVIAYLMKVYNMSFGEALAFCKKKRIVVNPNKGFRAQLVTYEIDLLEDVDLMFNMDTFNLVAKDDDIVGVIE